MRATKLLMAGLVTGLLLASAMPGLVAAQPSSSKLVPTSYVVYKMTPQRNLQLYIFDPAGWKASDTRPAMVFFHGGGWIGGSASQFFGQSANLARRGMVAISVGYRVSNRDKTSPFQSVRDAFSAMRWIRAHAKKLGINPTQIAAGGGSAGGATRGGPGYSDGKLDRRSQVP